MNNSIIALNELISIFKDKSNPILNKPKLYACQTNNCNITALLTVLKHYNLNDIDYHQNEFLQYLERTKKSLIDDYIHFVTEHSCQHDLKSILDCLVVFADKCEIVCNIHNCMSATRHHRERSQDVHLIRQQNMNFTFYRDIVDQIHCYLYHLYDTGMRSTANDIKNKENTAVCKIVEENAKKSQTVHSSKFIINSQLTFMDGLLEHMNIKKFSNKQIEQLKIYLEDEDFDSDALKGYEHCGHALIVNNDIHSGIKQYVYDCKVHSHCFSTGYIFYYWKTYDDKSFEQNNCFDNQNDHGGFKEHELFVKIKYKDLKEEILNNGIHSLKQTLFNISIHKVTKFIDTKKAKKIKSQRRVWLHYDIKVGTPFSNDNLLSLILYTDQSDLCTAFTATFRKKQSWECIESVKQRNREFANWSKLLRETVQLFGQQGYEGNPDDPIDRNWNKRNNRVSGPFFCGLNFVMVFPELNIRLCGPTSTSKQTEVATRFADDNGIIIQLNNNGYKFSQDLRIFGCSWFSAYSSEDEYLFIGGNYPIKIENIQHVENSISFSNYTEPIFYFDCVVKGVEMRNDFIIADPKTTCLMLNNLINHQLKLGKCENKYPRYVNVMFECFVQRKEQIVINLFFINEQLKIFKDLLLDKKCVLKPMILNLFANCRHILIYTTDEKGENAIIIDLLCILTFISVQPRNIKITIVGKWTFISEIKCSWVKRLWDACSSHFTARFNNAKYNVTLRKEVAIEEEYQFEDHLTIESMEKL
eukprot:542532_1